MKRTSILLLALGVLVFTSCRPSRVWENKNRSERAHQPAPRPAPAPVARNYYPAPLLIFPTPGFTMNRNHDGRYFHRNPQGLIYWKGFDNRFFLDPSCLSRVSYSDSQYRAWKRYRNESRSGRNRR